MVQNQLPPTYQYAQTPGLEEYQPVMVQTPVSSLPAEFKSDPSVFTTTAITTAVTANGGVEQQTVRTRGNLNVRWVLLRILRMGLRWRERTLIACLPHNQSIKQGFHQVLQNKIHETWFNKLQLNNLGLCVTYLVHWHWLVNLKKSNLDVWNPLKDYVTNCTLLVNRKLLTINWFY